MPEWSSEQYLKFENQRTQPAIDLVRRISITEPKKIVDVGCGPGNSTNVLAKQFPQAQIIGVDNSENMIVAAKSSYSNLNFKVCDAGKGLNLLGNDYDIVFSNACIQWIPNHKSLISNMMELLRSGGELAVQTPMNYDEPIHKIISEISTSKKWKNKFSTHRVFYNLTQSEYYDLLSQISVSFTMWETVYFHRMSSHQSIMEWYRGTGLRPYLSALPENEKALFEKEVFEEVVKAYPVQANGEIIFKFPRLFFIAAKK